MYLEREAVALGIRAALWRRAAPITLRLLRTTLLFADKDRDNETPTYQPTYVEERGEKTTAKRLRHTPC